MSTFEIDLTNEVFIFFSDFLLSWYIKLSWKYFLNKKPQKQPLCSLYCRGRQRLSTEHHCEVRHGTLRLSTRILRLLRLLLKVYSSLPTTHHNSTKKKFRLPYRYRNWILASVRFQIPKPGFGRTLSRTLAPYFEIITCCLLLFITCLNFPLKRFILKFFREVGFNQVGDENLGCITISICKPICEICYRWVELTFELLSIFYDNK